MLFVTFTLFWFFLWIFPYVAWVNIMYCCFGVILFGLYLVFDTQLIMGGKKYEFDYDDYIWGALMLYIDII